MHRPFCRFLALIAVALLGFGPQDGWAQFSESNRFGGSQNRASAGQSRTTTGVAPSGFQTPSAGRGQFKMNQGGLIFMSDHHRKMGVSVGESDFQDIFIWARSVQHTDGRYTESKQDSTTQTLEQITKSKNGVKLQRRLVEMDGRGRPHVVQIFDGRDQFKYRGKLHYDGLGRFVGEELFDASGNLIRTKVQKYHPTAGYPLALQSVDHVANVPSDLRLVITRENEAATNPESSGTGLFGQKKTRQAPVLEGATERPKADLPGGLKGLGRKLFGGKR